MRHLIAFALFLSVAVYGAGQAPVKKDDVVPKKAVVLNPEPPAINRGDALSPMTPVVRPGAINGLISWTLETRTHRGSPSSFALSPDGSTMATGGFDGTVHLWDAATGKLQKILVGHQSSVYGVAWSPDGTMLASTGSFDKTARVWNPKTGMTLRTLKNHKGFTQGVAWSPDGGILAVSGGTSGFVVFWDLAMPKQLGMIEHGTALNGFAWSPDSKMVACASQQGAILWTVADGQNAGTIRVAGNKVHAVGWSPDGKRVLAGAQKTTDVYDNTGKKLLASLSGTGGVTTWSPDGATIAVSYGGGMLLFDGVNYAPIRQPPVPAMALTWDKKTGDLWALTGQDVHGLNIKDENKKRKFPVAAGDTLEWASGRPHVAGIGNAGLKFWDTGTGKQLQSLDGHAEPITCIAWSRDGKRLASGSEDMSARVWDGVTGKSLRTLTGHRKKVQAVAWSPTGMLATGSEDTLVRIFPVDSDKPIELKGHTHPVRALTWRDERTLISGGEDGKVIFWNAETGKPIQTIEVGHDVLSLMMSPDGQFLAVGSDDDVARIYSPSGGNALHTLDPKNPSTNFYVLSWSPDGVSLATTNNRLQLWSPKTAKVLHGYQMSGPARNIAWSADGKTTVAGGSDRSVRFCDTPQGFLKATMIVAGKQLITIGMDGHYKAPFDVDADLVYVVQSDKSQDTIDVKAFPAKFAWKNTPALVKP